MYYLYYYFIYEKETKKKSIWFYCHNTVWLAQLVRCRSTVRFTDSNLKT